MALYVTEPHDHFLIYFSGERGVNAGQLGDLLARISTVARHSGVSLEVVAIEPGSLQIIMRVIGSAKRELMRSPIQIAIASILAANALTPGAPATPLAKSASKIVLSGDVERIEIHTDGQKHLLMDLDKATHIKSIERHRGVPTHYLNNASDEMKLIYLNALGEFPGTVHKIGDHYFLEVQGVRSLIYLDLTRARGDRTFGPGSFIIRGKLLSRGELIDGILVDSYSKREF